MDKLQNSPYTCRVSMMIAFLSLMASKPMAEPTTFVREMSKCSTPIEIVYSGDKAKPYADKLAEAIRTRQDFNAKKAVEVKSVDAFESGTHPAPDAETVVAIVAREEAAQLAPKLGSLFSGVSGPFEAESCRLLTKIVRAKAGQIAFDTLIEAPTGEDLAGAMDRFLNFSTVNWRDLKMDDQLVVNRVFTTGVNVLSWIPDWGRLPGNIVNTVTFADSLPEGGNGDQVFFWNRSSPSSMVPAAFKPLTDGLKLGPLTFAAVRQTQPNGHYLSLFVAPSEKVLEHLADRYPTVRSIGDPGFIGQVNDLRAPKRTLLVSNSIGVDGATANDLAGALENDLRNRVRLNIAQRGSAPEISGTDLLSPDVAKGLVANYGYRWAVVMEVSDANGTVEYRAEEQCLSALPAQYDQAAPSEPVRHPLFGHRMTDEEWAKAQEKYRRDLADYKDKKEKYEYEDQVQWKRSIVKKSYGQVHVTLKLIDLEANSKVIWSTERNGKVEESSVLRSDTETVRGHLRKPRPLDCPRPESTAPQAVRNAGVRVLTQEVRDLIGESLLPNEDISLPVASVDIKTISVEPPLITINAGSAQGLKIGDHVTVEIFRDIVDPTTKEVIERVSTDKLMLEVVRVGKTSDCKATTPKDAELLLKIKVGDVVQIVKG